MTDQRFAVARAPGRVNLIGDHTDYNEGLALPMAIDLGVEVTLTEGDDDQVVVTTAFDPEPAVLSLDLPFDPDSLQTISPPWARMVGAVLALARPARGGTARVTATLPPAAGLSSSAACCVALALAFGVTAPPLTMARMCRRAEAAAGADVGLMDPLVIMAAEAGHALLIDFSVDGHRADPGEPGTRRDRRALGRDPAPGSSAVRGPSRRVRRRRGGHRDAPRAGRGRRRAGVARPGAAGPGPARGLRVPRGSARWPRRSPQATVPPPAS